MCFLVFWLLGQFSYWKGARILKHLPRCNGVGFTLRGGALNALLLYSSSCIIEFIQIQEEPVGHKDSGKWLNKCCFLHPNKDQQMQLWKRDGKWVSRKREICENTHFVPWPLNSSLKILSSHILHTKGILLAGTVQINRKCLSRAKNCN